MATKEVISVNSETRINPNGRPVASDEHLVNAAKTGQRAAFGELYKRHRAKVFSITHRITRNCEDAEDAVQDCFTNAFIHLNNFNDRSSFLTWLTRIAINAALMKVRKNHRLREHSMEQAAPAGEPHAENLLADWAPNPEELFARTEQATLLSDAITALRPSIRRALQIHQQQDRSIQETADILGISLAATKARIFHAKAALRRTCAAKFAWTRFVRGPSRSAGNLARRARRHKFQ